MAVERDALRDWHRLFGLLLADFFTGSPFTVEVERDLSEQQQLLDVVIVRRGRGRFVGRLPDGLAAHNLITFKSHREALDAWAMKELIGHYVAYRKLVSRPRSPLLPEDQFQLYAVCTRFPHNLSGQLPWQEQQAGVYDYRWGTDEVRVIAAGQLAREADNAPLHLFSASPELVNFAGGAYQRRSEQASGRLGWLFEALRGEGSAVSYTMEDFERDYIKEHFPNLTAEQRQEILQSLSPEEQCKALEYLPPERVSAVMGLLQAQRRRAILDSLPPMARWELLEALPPEERLAGLSEEQIRQYLDRLSADRRVERRRPRRKK